MAGTETGTLNKVEVKEPSMFNVIFMNDDVTSQQFVTQVLVEVFGHDNITAEELMMTVHQDGSAVVATLPFEIAEQKSYETLNMAYVSGFPLVVKLEEE